MIFPGLKNTIFKKAFKVIYLGFPRLCESWFYKEKKNKHFLGGELISIIDINDY